jgi:hypothetical protein
VGTLYRSDSNAYFQNANRNSEGWVDFECVHGVDGFILANVVDNPVKVAAGGLKELRSKISFTDGASWSYIKPPDKPPKGKKFGCNVKKYATGECSLHLNSVTHSNNIGRVFSAEAAHGVLMGVGNVGSKLLEYYDCDTFLSYQIRPRHVPVIRPRLDGNHAYTYLTWIAARGRPQVRNWRLGRRSRAG